MKIEIYFLNSKLTTEIKKDIQVKDLLSDLKEYLNTKDSNFILFDNKHVQLKETDIISTKNGKQSTFYLIKSSLNKNNLLTSEKKELNEKLSKEQLIMHCTGAKKPLDIKKQIPLNINHRVPLLELFENRNNDQGGENNAFDRLLNILQVLEENNQIAFRIGQVNNNNNNNTQIEADEQALQELKDMGFQEDHARQALINSRNDINRATEILLGEGGE